jgi:hypothetical protein
VNAEAYPLEVVEILRSRLPSKPYLHQFLAGSSVASHPPPPPKQPNPEKEKRLQEIKRICAFSSIYMLICLDFSLAQQKENLASGLHDVGWADSIDPMAE